MITKNDIKAMKQADKVCFEVHAGIGRIRCIKEIQDPYVYEVEYGIEMPYFADNFGPDKFDSAFHMFFCAKHTPYWQTILTFIRVNDSLSLRWHVDNNNGYIKDAGLHCDELFLEVTRNETRFLFFLASSITPGNSARMVKVA